MISLLAGPDYHGRMDLRRDLDLGSYAPAFAADGVTVIDNFLAADDAERVHAFIWKDMPVTDWKACFCPPPDGNQPLFVPNLAEHAEWITRERERVRRCLALGSLRISYSFKRSVRDHVEACTCPRCAVEDFMASPTVLDAVGAITGTQITGVTSVFTSWYDGDDFLSLHSDAGLGRIAFVLSLTKNWKYVYGGNLTILESDWNTPRRVFVPRFNTLILFDIPEKSGRPHTVTPVLRGVKDELAKRMAVSGWFRGEKR